MTEEFHDAGKAYARAEHECGVGMSELMRDDPRGDILGLTTLTHLSTSQMISLIVGIGAAVLLVIRWRRANATANTKGLVTSNAQA